MKKKLGKNRYQPLAERDGARGVATPGVGVCVWLQLRGSLRWWTPEVDEPSEPRFQLDASAAEFVPWCLWFLFIFPLNNAPSAPAWSSFTEFLLFLFFCCFFLFCFLLVWFYRVLFPICCCFFWFPLPSFIRGRRPNWAFPSQKKGKGYETFVFCFAPAVPKSDPINGDAGKSSLPHCDDGVDAVSTSFA